MASGLLRESGAQYRASDKRLNNLGKAISYLASNWGKLERYVEANYACLTGRLFAPTSRTDWSDLDQAL